MEEGVGLDLDGENKSQCSHIISSEKWGSSLTILKSIYNHLFLDSSAVSMRLVYSGLNEIYMLENSPWKGFQRSHIKGIILVESGKRIRR